MKRILFILILSGSFSVAAAVQTAGQKRLYDVCGDPTTACGSVDHGANLPLGTVGELEHFGQYRSKPFYAVIIESRKIIRKGHPADDDYQCGGQFSGKERATVQVLFPRNRVFSTELGCYHWDYEYTNVRYGFNFLAIYAGRTKSEAAAVLKALKTLEKYPGANLRRMSLSRCVGCH